MIAGLLLLAGGATAGLFGSLLGLGGGVLLVPLLTLGFDRPLREAVAVSLVSVVVTSSAAAGAYLRSRLANLRLGMVLTLFTVVGAFVGGLIAFLVPDRLLAGLFALLILYVGASMARSGLSRPAARSRPAPAAEGDAAATPATGSDATARDATAGDATAGSDATAGDAVDRHAGRQTRVAWLEGPGYVARRLVPASIVSVGAGILAVLLGVGGGVVNVPTMHLLMRVPLRVATATSNLMIGVTAVAGAIIYLLRGELDPYLAGPTALGVFAGASVGARAAHRIDLRVLQLLFVAVLLWTAVQMARRAVG